MSKLAIGPKTLSKSARNERTKLLANSVNTIGLAALGLGFLTPIFAGQITRLAIFRMIASASIFVAFHFIARQFLRSLED